MSARSAAPLHRRRPSRWTPIAACALLTLAPAAGAETFAAVDGQMDQKLERSLRDLASARERITREKIPLSREVSKLEERVLALRQKQAELLKLRDSRTIDLPSLREQVTSLGTQEDFVNSRLNEFVRDFEGRLDISELPRFERLTSAAKLAEQNANVDEGGKREAQIAVVEAAIDRVSDQLGGRIFDGAALSPDGVLTRGSFIALGPSVFYASEDGSVTGLVENQLNAADPVVVGLPDSFDAGIATLVATGSGELPFDATLGKALRIEKASKGVMEYVEDGGVVGYVIVVLGFAALALTLFKSFEIRGLAVAEPEEVDGILGELAGGDPEAAKDLARRVPGVAGELLTTGVEHADEKRGVLEELLFEKVLKVRPTLERFLPFLAITAAAAPLLGLLGTVIGMIKTFQLITIFGTGDAKSLSSGISEALVTTALGLIVAIPTLVLHGALSRMAKRKISLLEEASVAFVNGVVAIQRAASRLPAPTLGMSRDG